MHVLIWEYRVRADGERRFVEHYAASGSWAQLFSRAPGYLGTELLRSPLEPLHFVTVDRWITEAHHRDFLENFREEYVALDAQCEELTVSETFLGSFESTAGSEG